MTKARKRLCLYGSALGAAAALLFVGFAVKLPADPGVLLSSASAQAQLGLFEQARATLRELLDREPRNARALWMDAYCAHQLGRIEEASSGYQMALERVSNPDQQTEIRVALASLELEGGRPGKGLEWLGDALPESAFWRGRLLTAEGACHEALGDWGAAEARFEGAAALCDTQAKFSLARLKFWQGDAERASTLLRELASEDPRLLRRVLQWDNEFSGAIRERGLLPE